MANRAPGRPATPVAPTTPITAPDVAPVITVAQLARLGERLGCANQTEFAEALGISQAYLSLLSNGKRQIVGGPLLMLLVDRMHAHGIRLPKA